MALLEGWRASCTTPRHAGPTWSRPVHRVAAGLYGVPRGIGRHSHPHRPRPRRGLRALRADRRPKRELLTPFHFGGHRLPPLAPPLGPDEDAQLGVPAVTNLLVDIHVKKTVLALFR